MDNKLRSLVDREFESLDVFTSEFDFGISQVQSELFQEFIDFIDSLPQKQGNFLTDKDIQKLLLRFEQGLLKAIEKGNYNRLYQSLVKNFDELEKLTKDINIITNPKDRAKILKANVDNIRKKYANQLATTLASKETFQVNFLNPLKNIIYEHSVLGLSVQKAKESIFDIAISSPNGGKLRQYAGQVAHDALFGFSGAINHGIGEYIGAKDVYYIGGLVRDSRPQCVRWVTKFKGFIPGDKLENEIEWAKKNGGGYSKHLPELTVQTFAVVRGGHNCKHQVKYTKGENKSVLDIKDRYEKLAQDYEDTAAKKLDGKELELYNKNKEIIESKKAKAK